MKRVAALFTALAVVSCSGRPDVSSNLRGQTFSVDAQEKPPAEAAPPPNFAASEYAVSGPFTHENLTVFLLRRPGVPRGDAPYLSLEEAFRRDVLRVSEVGVGGQVNRLEVENSGDVPIYLQAGDTVKGGKQDRTIAIDWVLPARSGKTTVDAFCVEPGRWELRAAVSTSDLAIPGRFAEAEAPVATKGQKLAIKEEKSQAQVWDEGRRVHRKFAYQMADFPGVDLSFALAAENPELQKKAAAFSGALLTCVDGTPDAVGMAYAVNGEMSTIELYATPALFLKLWPKLLKGAALEAIAEKPNRASAKAAVTADVVKLLEQASQTRGRMRSLPGDMRLKSYAGTGVALFDTEKGGELLHRQIIQK